MILQNLYLAIVYNGTSLKLYTLYSILKPVYIIALVKQLLIACKNLVYAVIILLKIYYISKFLYQLSIISF